ncbi:uncharacterized protein BKA55DRAFT_136436 [Fusarium redolens]|uniref:Secreted protein n=1 Tax=Fusarium redolens TaxID=48865 RepID=A0A9P9GE73_FUSRE|nr:uncharacterized protein BKA55DRAFT_136436 [Fusarium redolens]KAH7237158.1 hypothetical protein BKA55DRAFT_136436 [Fusarium redolens]
MQFKNFLVILAAITGASATCTGTSSCQKTCSCTCTGTTLTTNGASDCPDCNCPNTPTLSQPNSGLSKHHLEMQCSRPFNPCNYQLLCQGPKPPNRLGQGDLNRSSTSR